LQQYAWCTAESVVSVVSVTMLQRERAICTTEYDSRMYASVESTGFNAAGSHCAWHDNQSWTAMVALLHGPRPIVAAHSHLLTWLHTLELATTQLRSQCTAYLVLLLTRFPVFQALHVRVSAVWGLYHTAMIAALNGSTGQVDLLYTWQGSSRGQHGH
jgi:hypothetical protein